MPGKNLCKFVSLNVRGIRNYEKRSSIFSFLKDQEAFFYFLQETFSDPVVMNHSGKMNGVAK